MSLPGETDRGPWDRRLVERMSRSARSPAPAEQKRRANPYLTAGHGVLIAMGTAAAGGHYWIAVAAVGVLPAAGILVYRWVKRPRSDKSRKHALSRFEEL